MRILRVFHSLDPKSGGPVEASLQSSRAMINLGHQVEFASFDPPDQGFLKIPNIKCYAFKTWFPRHGFSLEFIQWLRKNHHNYDCVISQGIWQFQSFGTFLALLGKNTPYFVFTHGMLDPWFNLGNPLKKIKKCIYWFIAERWTLRGAKLVLFTSEKEKILAKGSMPFSSFECAISPYGISQPDPIKLGQINLFEKGFDPNLKRCLLYLGRIHPKKGCDLLLTAFKDLVINNPNFHLIMAGPDDSEWAKTLKHQFSLTELNNHITWTGMLEGDRKEAAFKAADAFILPSHQENFGIAVAEALARSLPVLISNQVNIHKTIEDSGAGFVFPDTIEGCINVIQKWSELQHGEVKSMRINAKRCFDENYDINKTSQDLIKLLKS